MFIGYECGKKLHKVLFKKVLSSHMNANGLNAPQIPESTGTLTETQPDPFEKASNISSLETPRLC